MPKRKKRAQRKSRNVKSRARRGAPARPRPAAIEATLAAIAHDIRTPLTGILALAELLSSSDLGKREREWAQAIKSGAEHLAGLTTLIVDAVKADASGLVLRNEIFSPRALAETVGQALAARAGNRGLSAEIAIAADLPAAVEGDAVRLRAALENLVDNAVKFTGTGTVVFTAGERAGRGGRIDLVFTVADTGIGMAPGELKKLFRPFAQGSKEVSRRYGGAGLGLVFVERIAKAMQGALTVRSTPGQGTTFRLIVPVKPVAAAGERADARGRHGRPLRLLCAEDNPYGRVIMNAILTQLGHQVDFVESGEAAVAAVARGGYDAVTHGGYDAITHGGYDAITHGGYDAVLVDVTLPGIDGFETTRRIRAITGEAGIVPVIGLSGRDDSGSEATGRAAGMNFYFVKPVGPGRLAEALASLP
jgi:CheY-like chemotaxis protein